MADTHVSERIPITLLTGFLGTGKTTLLKRYLTSQPPGSIAVIVNEYGSTQVDGNLVSFAGDTAALETTNGCLCCTISGDVRDVLLEFAGDITAGKLKRFNQLIIETTGLADPMSLVHALTTNADLNAFYRFDQTVTLVDAIKGEHWFERFPECRKQILLADRVLISKTDLIEDPISKRELEQFTIQLTAFNPVATLAISDQATAITALRPTQEALEAEPGAQNSLGSNHTEDHVHHHHGHGVNSFCLSYDRPLDRASLQAALVALGERYGAELLRVKGLVRVDREGDIDTLLVQGVGGIFQFTEIDAQSSIAASQLVFITNALSEPEAYAHLESAMGETIAFV